MRVHEGDTVRTNGRPLLTKACDCSPASASGPRVVQGEVKTMGDTVSITMILAPLACDECDMPWESQPEASFDLNDLDPFGALGEGEGF